MVTLRAGFKDHHNVASSIDYRIAFATSATLDTGRISGRILFRRQPSEKGVVRCFVLPRDSGFAPEAARPDREALTNEAGQYVLDYLPSRGDSFVVWAFHNKGNDNQFDAGKDIGDAFADTVVLTRERPTAESIDIWIVDPGEPGRISGRVINDTGVDTVEVAVALFAANDTLRPSYYGRCTTDGAFEFSSTKAGTYALRAFVDFKADSVCGSYPCGADSLSACSEPCTVSPDSLTLAPGDEIRVPAFRLGPVE